jgi:small subunit ribosomal protein S14
MAKKSMIAREVRRLEQINKSYIIRKELRKICKSSALSFEEKNRAQNRLQKMPRDSSSIRLRNRCGETGRPHGYYRKFGLGRNKLREAVMRGDVPGVTMASW